MVRGTAVRSIRDISDIKVIFTALSFFRDIRDDFLDKTRITVGRELTVSFHYVLTVYAGERTATRTCQYAESTLSCAPWGCGQRPCPIPEPATDPGMNVQSDERISFR